MSTDAGAAVPSPATVSKSAAGHIRLTSHSGGFGALPIHWGAATAAERGPVLGTTIKRVAPKRDRHPQRLLQRLPGAGGGRGRAVEGAQGRPHQHLAHRHPRPVPAVERPRRDRQPGPVGGHGGRRVQRRAGRRLRHPPHHRGHQGARHPAGDHRGRAEGPAAAPTAASCCPAARRSSPRPPSSRSGTCPGWRSASAAARPICAACCSRRPAACTPSW